MKPCSRNRKNIALLAMNALDATAAAKLREHIATCAGCQEYLGEISGIAGRLSGAREASEMEASERFHQRLRSRIHATEPFGNTAVAYLNLLKWRILIPAAGISLIVGITVGLFYRPIGISRHQIAAKTGITAGADAEDLSPTFANYQNAANRSFDQLDSLLTRQARQGLPPAQIYRASATALAEGSL